MMVMARNGKVGMVNTPCTPKNSAEVQLPTVLPQDAQTISAKTIAPAIAKLRYSATRAMGSRAPIPRIRKSARVSRPCMMAWAT